MGSGRWDTNTYAATTRSKIDSGSTFAYSNTMHRTSRANRKAHESLDPKTANKAGEHEGQNIRESLDSDEHPTSTAVSVLFDVTGSMRLVPQGLQEKLPQLLGVLMRRGYVEHPQILFGGIGDATCDAVPLQIAQFESDNRLDDHLDNIFLEGGGGGQKTESYELAAYFMARHTHIDCYEKRGHKGYLFLIGDEMNYPAVSKDQVAQHIGGGLQEDIPTEDIYQELMEKYEVFYLLPQGTSYYGQTEILDHWTNLLGIDRVLQVESLDAICETIAMSIGLVEGAVDVDGAVEDLLELGASEEAAKSAAKATTALTKRDKGSITEADTPTDLVDTNDEDEESGLERV